VRWFVVSVVFQLSHGYNVQSLDDPLVLIADEATSDFAKAVSPGAFLVDMLPILKYVPEWFPAAGFKTKAREWRVRNERITNGPFEHVRRQVKEGTASPSFASKLIGDNPNATAEEESVFRSAVMSMYAAGSDTTVSAIDSFFLVMSLYPDVQQKAQAEIDTVMIHTSGRLPTFADRPDLLYIEALIKEIHRWNPVVPLSLPHYLIQEDTYNGYTIPAGTTVIPNSWGILHNPSLYPDPFVFRPERYLTKEGVNDGINPDPRPYAFGYGRRVCPGESVADASLFITVVKLLASFNITKALNEHGEPIEPVVEYSSAIMSHPGPFRCAITSRSGEVESLISGVALQA